MISTEVKMSPIKTEDVPFPQEAFMDRPPKCRHEWRIIESYHAEFPRESKDPRRYAAYCVYCLKSSGINVQLTNNKEE